MKKFDDSGYVPLLVKLVDQACLVVGGGDVAERKIRELVKVGARVTVVSPEFTDGLAAMAAEGAVTCEEKVFEPKDVEGAALVVAATDSEIVNRQVAAEAHRRGMWCNVVSDPELCTVMVPSIFRRGKLTLAISTGGASPALARHIRHELDEIFGAEYGLALEVLAELRKVSKRLISDRKQREIVFKRILTADLLELCRDRAENRLIERIKNVAGPKVSGEMTERIRCILGNRDI